ncbi:hypothetical protein DY000_02009916 [Brassica cretica]|uniref:Uncharacterized protein n=1 Tax=Brassica cretica TaxID=69181 RepID=A0ABQ7C6W8_BRACR|nr:hypothetical protein DY000_02009916 [Brassica cretica]
MDFSFGYYSKARILKLSEDWGYVGAYLGCIWTGAECHIQANISQIRWSCESYQATVRDSSFGGLVSHIKHQLKSKISEAFRNLRATLQSIQFSIQNSYPNQIQSSEPILGSFKWYQSHSSGIF